MTTQPTIDMAAVARQNVVIDHALNHLALGLVAVMLPILAAVVVFALVRRR